MLTDEEAAYFQDMEALFRHPGWQRLTEELDRSLAAAPEDGFWGVKDWNELLVRRATIEARRTLRDYPEAVSGRKEHLLLSRVEDMPETDGRE